MSKKIRKIGILGGAFNPIHDGHLQLIVESFRKLHLKHLYIVPTGVVNVGYETKSDLIYLSNEDRVNLITLNIRELLCEYKEYISVWDIELRLNKSIPTYELLTIYLDELNIDKKDTVIIVGDYTRKDIKRWKDGDKLLKEFEIYSSGIRYNNISSTSIRQCLKKGINAVGLSDVSIDYYKDREMWSLDEEDIWRMIYDIK